MNNVDTLLPAPRPAYPSSDCYNCIRGIRMNVNFPPSMLVGTSSWSSPDWCGSFYPESIDPGDMIQVYSSKLPTVEIDATWYRMPNLRMVEAWKSRTPDKFIFSAKVPNIITHEKYLEDCGNELREFLSIMSRLGNKLGPLILQFAYVPKRKDPREYETGSDFIERLKGLKCGTRNGSNLLYWIFYAAETYPSCSLTITLWILSIDWPTWKGFIQPLLFMCAFWVTAKQWTSPSGRPKRKATGNAIGKA
jgi:hypothetical protein